MENVDVTKARPGIAGSIEVGESRRQAKSGKQNEKEEQLKQETVLFLSKLGKGLYSKQTLFKPFFKLTSVRRGTVVWGRYSGNKAWIWEDRAYFFSNAGD